MDPTFGREVAVAIPEDVLETVADRLSDVEDVDRHTATVYLGDHMSLSFLFRTCDGKDAIDELLERIDAD